MNDVVAGVDKTVGGEPVAVAREKQVIAPSQPGGVAAVKTPQTQQIITVVENPIPAVGTTAVVMPGLGQTVQPELNQQMQQASAGSAGSEVVVSRGNATVAETFVGVPDPNLSGQVVQAVVPVQQAGQTSQLSAQAVMQPVVVQVQNDQGQVMQQVQTPIMQAPMGQVSSQVSVGMAPVLQIPGADIPYLPPTPATVGPKPAGAGLRSEVGVSEPQTNAPNSTAGAAPEPLNDEPVTMATVKVDEVDSTQQSGANQTENMKVPPWHFSNRKSGEMIDDIQKDVAGDSYGRRGGSSSKSIGAAAMVVAVVLVLLGVAGVIGGGVAAAYGKLTVSDEMKAKLQAIVFQIPLLPKPPEIVLLAAGLAMEEVESMNINLSLAFKSETLSQALGSEDFDLMVRGPIDVTDPDKPRMNLKFATNNQIDADLLVDGDTYFRINTVPQALLGMVMGATRDDSGAWKSLLGDWVRVENSSVDSSAREALEQNHAENQEGISEEMREFLEKQIEPLLTMEEQELNGKDMYKIEAEFKGQIINDFFKIIDDQRNKPKSLSVVDTDEILPSDVLKKVKMTIWVEKNTNYMNKVDFYMLVDNSVLVDKSEKDVMGSLLPMSRETIEMAASLVMSNFNNPTSITPPSDYVELEDYVAEVMGLVRGPYEQQMMQLKQQNSELTDEELEQLLKESEQQEQLYKDAWGSQVLGVWTEENGD